MNFNVWECPNNCDLSRGLCKHLEKLLPDVQDGRISSKVLGEWHDTTITEEVYEDTCFRIELELKRCGLNRAETGLIMDRFVSGLTFKELAAKYTVSVYSVLDELGRLRERIQSPNLYKVLKDLKNWKTL